MKFKGKLKSQKLDKKKFLSLKEMHQHIKAGYPPENPQSHEKDENGQTAIYKAHQLNFANKNFIPYLRISLNNNKNKYSKVLKQTLKFSQSKTFEKRLDKLGMEMVTDIQSTLEEIQTSPVSSKAGCIYGAVSFIRIKK